MRSDHARSRNAPRRIRRRSRTPTCRGRGRAWARRRAPGSRGSGIARAAAGHRFVACRGSRGSARSWRSPYRRFRPRRPNDMVAPRASPRPLPLYPRSARRLVLVRPLPPDSSSIARCRCARADSSGAHRRPGRDARRCPGRGPQAAVHAAVLLPERVRRHLLQHRRAGRRDPRHRRRHPRRLQRLPDRPRSRDRVHEGQLAGPSAGAHRQLHDQLRRARRRPQPGRVLVEDGGDHPRRQHRLPRGRPATGPVQPRPAGLRSPAVLQREHHRISRRRAHLGQLLGRQGPHGSAPPYSNKYGRYQAMFPDQQFSAPFFIQYGPGNTHTADGASKYVYAVSNDGYAYNGNWLHLARVPHRPACSTATPGVTTTAGSAAARDGRGATPARPASCRCGTG